MDGYKLLSFFIFSFSYSFYFSVSYNLSILLICYFSIDTTFYIFTFYIGFDYYSVELGAPDVPGTLNFLCKPPAFNIIYMYFYIIIIMKKNYYELYKIKLKNCAKIKIKNYLIVKILIANNFFI